MIRTFILLLTLLACTACSHPGQSAPRAAAKTDPPSSAPMQIAATTEGKSGEMGIEARLILGKMRYRTNRDGSISQ